jgi:hypothetical protein
MSAAARAGLGDDFAAVGLALKQLYIQSISPTEETFGRTTTSASLSWYLEISTVWSPFFAVRRKS